MTEDEQLEALSGLDVTYDGIMMSISHWGCFPFDDFVVDSTVDWILAGHTAHYDLSFHGDEPVRATTTTLNLGNA